MTAFAEALLDRYRLVDALPSGDERGQQSVIAEAHDGRRVLIVMLPAATDAGAVLAAELERLERHTLGVPALARSIDRGSLRERAAVVYALPDGARSPADATPGEQERAIRELGSALSALHGQGLAHGGLCSELAWLGADGALWLAGFGLAQLAGTAAGAGDDVQAAAQLIQRWLGARSTQPAIAALLEPALAPDTAAAPGDIALWTRDVVRAVSDVVPEPPAAELGAEQLASDAPPPASGPSAPDVPPAPPRTSERPDRLVWFATASVALGVVLLFGGALAVGVYAVTRPSPAASAPVRATPLATIAPPSAIPAPSAAPSSAPEPQASDQTFPELAMAPKEHELHAPAHAGAVIPIDEDVPVWGDPSALVTITLFGDLQCPHTRRAILTLAKLKHGIGDDLRLAFRHRPLPAHEHAWPLAELAASVHQRLGDRAFWELVSAVAHSGERSARREIEIWANLHGVTRPTLDAWIETTTGERRVARDLQLAGRFDVRGTPTFFVNGVRLDGEQPLAELRRLVTRERNTARSGLALGQLTRKELYPARVAYNLLGLGPSVAERSCVPVGGSPQRGAPRPVVTLVEFSDFECEFCEAASLTVQALLAEYPNQIAHVWKSFPLADHPRARWAAAFALAAHQLGGADKFWRMHELLFDAAELDDDGLLAVARSVGLDGARLLESVRLGEQTAKLELDLEMAKRAEVSGVPTFFINGRRLAGAAPAETFERVIRQELSIARRLLKSGVAADRIYDVVCGETAPPE